MPIDLDTLANDIASINKAISRIEALIETESLRCPYREDIARAKNNLARFENLEGDVEKLEDSITDIRLKVAGWAGAISLFGGAIAAVITKFVQGG